MNEIVTTGNCPWRLIESDSLRRWKELNALKGTGVATTAPLVLLLLPPPPEGPVLEEREVPLVDVFALDEMLRVVLDSTVVLTLAVE